ncbi:MAG: SDR family oxidoreductase [Ignavibacteria bacterium]|jgi:NAD(P)-dependent dehydrogenase (short-subunit alcohol dehydrogenase family)|nr:SDR family oxidoreductase [Ignavibacteria bacterium]MCU7501990.1 SDR family oxidoreductase [Ignavibacteria bacterium]MCU7516958.1 SDR family oxidoreductase [Ignavibacteria bacterium]
MNTLSGKTAIVTGGGSGIGKAIASAFVKEGINVVITSRRDDVLKNTSEGLKALNTGKASYITCDVRNQSEVANAVRFTVDTFGGVDILVNNSGLGLDKYVIDCSEEEWDMVLDTNLKGTFLMTKEVLPLMKAQKSGYIINISSQAGKHGYPQAAPYCASKFGILGFAEALQTEVRDFGIHVHSLCPALVQVPAPENESDIMPGVLQTEDLASTVMFLLRQPRRIKYEDIGLFHF